MRKGMGKFLLMSAWVIVIFIVNQTAMAGEGDYVCDGAKLWRFVDGALVPAGKQIFADDFSGELSKNWDTAKVAHCWKTVDNTLVTTSWGGDLNLKADPGEAYVFEIKVKIMEAEPDKPNGLASVIASGLRVSLTQGSMRWSYSIPGEDRARGNWKDGAVPLDQWHDFRIVKRQGGASQWFVNGSKICEIIAPELKGGLSLNSWRLKVAYKDARLYRIEAAETSKVTANINLVRNSSFEQNTDGLAAFWGPSGASSARNIPIDGMDKFQKSWALDNTDSYDGKTSMRLANGSGAHSYYCEVQKDAAFTMSVYMKSDTDKTPVEISMPGAKKKVEVGREWERFTVSVDKMSAARVWLFIAVPATRQSDSTVWVDAVQLELGTEATPYKPNPLDIPASSAAGVARVTPVTIPAISGTPLMNGTLDDPLWKKAASMDLMIPGNLPGQRNAPKEQTKALLCHDNKNLYIGFHCADSDIKGIRANAKRDDDGTVAADDCVEVFISKTIGDKAFYRFVVNSAGVRFDSKGDDISWTSDWIARAVRGDNFWTLTVAIPLSAMELSQADVGLWGVNLCRGNPRTEEYPCSGPVLKNGMYFHQAANFTPVNWDDTSVFRPFCWQLSGVSFRKGDGSTLTLVGEIMNLSGIKQDVKVVADVLGKHFEASPVSIAAGERKSFSLPGFSDLDVKDFITNLKLVNAGNSQLLRQEIVRPPIESLIQAVIERSYYTTEKDAAVHVSIAATESVLKDMKLVCEVRKDGKVVRSFTKKASENSSPLLIPLADIPVGTYQLRLSLQDMNGKEVAETSDSLRKLEPKTNEVKIDRIKRIILVNGEPFFVFAPLQCFGVSSSSPYGNYDENIEKFIKYWADNGFKTLMVGANVGSDWGKWSERIWDQVFKSASTHGIKVVAFWTANVIKDLEDDEKRLRLENLILRWREEPALLAWLPIDEPEINAYKPQSVAKFIGRVKELDPYHPAFINYTQMGPGSRYAGLPGDIMSLDYYLTSVEGRTVKDTLLLVDAMNKAAVPMRTPVWNCIEGSEMDLHYREPSPEEQNAQTYGNVIKGGSGLMYYWGHPAGQRHWQRYKELDRELRELMPVIAGNELPLIKSNSPDILLMARQHGDATYLLCVNVDEKPHKGVFDLSTVKATGKAAVMFEKREVSVKDNVLSDDFAPYERHVYRLGK